MLGDILIETYFDLGWQRFFFPAHMRQLAFYPCVEEAGLYLQNKQNEAHAVSRGIGGVAVQRVY
jgi:hypothetical protein